MKKYCLTAIFCLLCTLPIFSCTMTPSVWHEIEQTQHEDIPTAYAVSEAFAQVREKFEKEMRAANLPIKPLVFVGMWDKVTEKTVSEETYKNVTEAMEVMWRDAEAVPYEKLELSYENMLTGARNNYADKYTVSLFFSNSSTTLINMIDLNPQIYELLRLVVRDELTVFVRIADESSLPLFVDELEVSPTLIVDPLISPIGGYLIRIEKNNSFPIAIDFGTVGDGTEHVLRVNTAFYQPEGAPPLAEFRTELLNKVEGYKPDSN